jgi:hypothetical protein
MAKYTTQDDKIIITTTYAMEAEVLESIGAVLISETPYQVQQFKPVFGSGSSSIVDYKPTNTNTITTYVLEGYVEQLELFTNELESFGLKLKEQ